jgi:hypothetical protein
MGLMFSNSLADPCFTFKEFQAETFLLSHGFFKTILKCLGIGDYASQFLDQQRVDSFSQLT